MSEKIMAIDVMNYLFTNKFMSEWMNTDEMRIIYRKFLKGELDKYLEG